MAILPEQKGGAIMKTIKKYAYGYCLGVVLAVAGINFMMWEFYVILVPTVILVEWKK